jgi:hypothetical protein
LDPTQRPAEIGRQLLGREKSPVAILAGWAAGGDCLLVIEQLDAVSVVSGRRPEVFDAVASLVREARAHANMRLLLVCRAFDLENDARLRDLREQEKTRATTISVGPEGLSAHGRCGSGPSRFCQCVCPPGQPNRLLSRRFFRLRLRAALLRDGRASPRSPSLCRAGPVPTLPGAPDPGLSPRR